MYGRCVFNWQLHTHTQTNIPLLYLYCFLFVCCTPPSHHLPWCSTSFTGCWTFSLIFGLSKFSISCFKVALGTFNAARLSVGTAVCCNATNSCFPPLHWFKRSPCCVLTDEICRVLSSPVGEVSMNESDEEILRKIENSSYFNNSYLPDRNYQLYNLSVNRR